VKSLSIVLALASAAVGLSACVAYTAPPRERIVVGDWVPGHWVDTPRGDRWVPGHYR
jgi:hypothetical protein